MSGKKELPTVMSGPSGERCDSCYYWWEIPEDWLTPHDGGGCDAVGLCHRYPPSIRPDRVHTEPDSDWPVLGDFQWCGEWKAMPKRDLTPTVRRERVEIQFHESDYSVAVDTKGFVKIMSDLIRPVTERAAVAMRAVGRVNVVVSRCVREFAYKWFGVSLNPIKVSLTTRKSFRVETLPPIETIFQYILDRDGEEYDLTDAARTTIQSAVDHLTRR